MKTEYIVAGVVAVAVVGYFIVRSSPAHAALKAPVAPAPGQLPAWLPPIAPTTKQYADYQVVQTSPAQPTVVWDLNTNQAVTIPAGPGSLTISQQENTDALGPDAASGSKGMIFWLNVGGASHRMYTAIPLS
jgi:hypothetical protein